MKIVVSFRLLHYNALIISKIWCIYRFWSSAVTWRLILFIFVLSSYSHLALVARKFKKLFVLLVYLFLVLKYSGEFVEAAKDVFNIPPATMQYKVKVEEFIMKQTQVNIAFKMYSTSPTMTKESLSQPGSHSII